MKVTLKNGDISTVPDEEIAAYKNTSERNTRMTSLMKSFLSLSVKM